MYFEAAEDENQINNNVNNKNNIDCFQSSLISTSVAMTSSVPEETNSKSSNFQNQHQQVQPNNNNSMISASTTNSINSTSPTTSLSSSSSSSFSTSTSPLFNNLNDKQEFNYSRDRTHLKLELKESPLANNNIISPMSLPVSLLDSASLLLSPEKILLAAQHQSQQQKQLIQNKTNTATSIQQKHNLLNQQKQQLETPTPSTILFPKNVTSEQEKFAEGWQKVLQEFQGRDTSLSTLQATSPSAVKLLLSLASSSLASSLSPFSTNKSITNSPLLQAASNVVASTTNISTTNNLNNTEIINNSSKQSQQQLIDLPKIFVNQQQQQKQQIINDNNNNNCQQKETANSIIAKRYMEYFQLGHAAQIAASSPTSSSIEFLSYSNQFNQQQRSSSVSTSLQPLLTTPTTPTSNPLVQRFVVNNNNQNLFNVKKENIASICDEQMDILVDTQMQNINNCPTSNYDDNRRSSSISNESSPKMNGKIQINSNGNCLNGYDDLNDVVDPKLEKKRARNREAAERCRKKKILKIAELEAQVAEEKQREQELLAEIDRLKEMVKSLREKANNNGGYQN